MNIISILEAKIGYIRNLPIANVQKVALYQMAYRLLCFDSSIYTVLHGSTTVTKNGNTVLFGDGVDSIGKTSTSLVVGLGSKKYVCDEFSLYNEATGCVYGNKEMPILARNNIREYLGDLGKDIKWNNGDETHILPSELGMEVVSGKISAIIAPHFGEENRMVEEKNFNVKARKVAIVANAHRLKLTEEGLDRANGQTISNNKIEMIDWTPGYKIPEGLMNIPYYDCYLQNSTDIVNLLEKEGL